MLKCRKQKLVQTMGHTKVPDCRIVSLNMLDAQLYMNTEPL